MPVEPGSLKVVDDPHRLLCRMHVLRTRIIILLYYILIYYYIIMHFLRHTNYYSIILYYYILLHYYARSAGIRVIVQGWDP